MSPNTAQDPKASLEEAVVTELSRCSRNGADLAVVLLEVAPEQPGAQELRGRLGEATLWLRGGARLLSQLSTGGARPRPPPARGLTVVGKK